MNNIWNLIFLLLITGVNGLLDTNLRQTSNWKGGSCYSISLKNTGDNTINDWKLKMFSTADFKIDEFWGCKIHFENNFNFIKGIRNKKIILGRRRVNNIGFCLSYDTNDINLELEAIYNNEPTTTSKHTTTSTTTTTTSKHTSTLTPTTTLKPTTTSKPSTTLKQTTTMSGEKLTTFSGYTTNTFNFKEDSWEGKSKVNLVNTWENGLCANMRIENTGNQIASDWYIVLKFFKNNKPINSNIIESWSSKIYQTAGKEVIIKNNNELNSFPGELYVRAGFCVIFDSHGDDVSYTSKVYYVYEQPTTTKSPFISELVNGTWNGKIYVKNTGNWEGGYCNTIRIKNIHDEYVADFIEIIINLNDVSNVYISEKWGIDEIFVENNKIFIKQSNINLYPQRFYSGMGFCVNFYPYKLISENEKEYNVSLKGDFMTKPPIQEYPNTKPGGENVMYMPHGYFYTYKDNNYIRERVEELKGLNIKYQYANLAKLDDNGILPEYQYSQLKRWVEQSRLTDPTQKIIAQINGYRDRHVWMKSNHYNIAYTCLHIIKQTNVDGVHLDIEPPRSDPEMIDLLKIIREVIGDDVYLSIAGSGSAHSWSKNHIIDVAKYVDTILPMLYDNSLYSDTKEKYEQWVGEAIENYNIIYKTPNLRKGVEIVPILPAYSNNKWHDSEIENIQNSIPVILNEIKKGNRVKGIGIWWYYEMKISEKEFMKNEFVNKF